MLRTPTSQDWIDETTIGVFSIATAGVFMVAATLRRVFGWTHPAVPFVCSIVISFGLAATKGKLDSLLGWFIAFLNTCMLFCAAVGVNESATDYFKEKPVDKPEKHGARPARFLESFFQ